MVGGGWRGQAYISFLYVQGVPQEHLQPSDSKILFFLEEFSLNPIAIKSSFVSKD